MRLCITVLSRSLVSLRNRTSVCRPPRSTRSMIQAKCCSRPTVKTPPMLKLASLTYCCPGRSTVLPLRAPPRKGRAAVAEGGPTLKATPVGPRCFADGPEPAIAGSALLPGAGAAPRSVCVAALPAGEGGGD